MLTVYDMSTEKQWFYGDVITPEDALINTHLLKACNVSGIHDPKTREKIRSLIVYGDYSLSIGDLSILVYQPERIKQ